ncbi:protein C3orf33 [Nematostella vectensis]|uniref:protein C3orf33 n=1 Tax=Nematostella vectensis TaxID=45351 RepID=UPI0020770804|nr:protein C3orf33 [Nematostella vectensis]
MVKEDIDVLTQASNFIDRHLRAIRNLTWLVGGVGIVIIIRRAYVLNWFKSVNSIPDEFIRKGIYLRGEVRGINEDNTLLVSHLPILKTPSYKRELSKLSDTTTTKRVEGLLPVNIAGIQYREGGNVWLKEYLNGTHVRFVPLRKTPCQQLVCIVHVKKIHRMLQIKEGMCGKYCVNEELVRQGLAVTARCKELENHKLYQGLFTRLLKAEVRAEKTGKGVWEKPSYTKHAKQTIYSMITWTRDKLSGSKKRDEVKHCTWVEVLQNPYHMTLSDVSCFLG